VFNKIDQVKIEEITAEAKRLFVPERLNLAIIGPYENDREFKAILS
jgi:predicted Zn-dependent peptidase